MTVHSMISTACQAMTTNGFEGFYHSIVWQFTPDMPFDYYYGFRDRTVRATLPLTSDEDAFFYSVAYAMGHYQTFRAVLADNLHIEAHDHVLNIIDYGCGQGIATLAMLDHIATFKCPKEVHLNIHLIEPSSISLGNACYKVLMLAQTLGFSVNITTQNCMLAQAVVPDFKNGVDNLHLMSYILDVPSVQDQLSHITNQIHELAGINHVIASDIAYRTGFDGLNLLSRQLIGYATHIERYNRSHQCYDVLRGGYANRPSKAIGFMLSLNNDLTFHEVA